MVMRHSERLDFADEDAWFQHPDSRSFPTDSPLTERGKSLAKVQGRMLAEMCENTGTPIDVIITSPFVRCVQTAIAVREVLPNRRGDKVPLLIDVEVSEVGIYKKPSGISDPALLRSHLEFCSRRRTFAQVAAIPDLTGVELLNADAFVGIPPPFPEKRRAAHVRGLYRFSEWMERGRQAQLNFLIVTHQDLVHTFCSMIKREVCVEWVKYCGWGAALIHRSLKVSTAEKMAKTPPAIHTLKVSSELGSGVRWSPYSVDPRTGRQMRWYPAAEESGVAAVATALSNQADGDLDEMKRYADAQALQRAFKGNKTFSLLVGGIGRSEGSTGSRSSGDSAARSVAKREMKEELDKEYDKVLRRDSNGEMSHMSSEEDMVSCERSAFILARKLDESNIHMQIRPSEAKPSSSFTHLTSVNEDGDEEQSDYSVNIAL